MLVRFALSHLGEGERRMERRMERRVERAMEVRGGGHRRGG
jgi:hypothetical protein